MLKNLILGLIYAPLTPNSDRQNLLSKICLRQSLDFMVSYHHVQNQKKLMIQSSENLVMDRQTDEGTDRRTGVIS